jgi:hypothetical protein
VPSKGEWGARWAARAEEKTLAAYGREARDCWRMAQRYKRLFRQPRAALIPQRNLFLS